MRWPWQRKTAPVRTPAVPTHRSDWRRVGTLRPTADVHAPTLVPTGLPVLASTRSLLHRARTESPQAPAGRVSGLARISPVAQPDPVSIVSAPVRATVAARPVRATLTHAVAEFVGEPRVPAVPHRAPAWLRNAPPQMITPLDAFASPMETSSLPEMTLLDSWTTKPPALDQEMPEVVEEPVEPTPRPPIRRRRPGLGLPLPPGERPPTQVQQPAEQPRQQPQPPMVVDAPAPTVQEAPKLVHPTVVPGRFSARVPADLAETFERAYGVEVADVYPQRPPDLFLRQPLLLYGRISQGHSGRLRLTARTGAQPYEANFAFNTTTASFHPGITTLWARQRVEDLIDHWRLSDEDARAGIRAALIAHAIRYRLVTRFTSLVAVEEIVANASGASTTVPVAAELPAGMQLEKVFGAPATGTADAFLEALGVALLLLSLVLWLLVRRVGALA